MSSSPADEEETGHLPPYSDDNGKVSGGDDSSIEPVDEMGNGEVLHCLFPGCMKGTIVCQYY